MHICVCIYFYNFEEDPANILQRCSVCVIAAHRQSALSKYVALWLSSSPPPNSHSLHQGSCAFTAAKAAVLVAVNSVQNFCGLLLIEALQSKSVFHLPDESPAKSIFYVCSTCITCWDSSVEEDVFIDQNFLLPQAICQEESWARSSYQQTVKNRQDSRVWHPFHLTIGIHYTGIYVKVNP